MKKSDNKKIVPIIALSVLIILLLFVACFNETPTGKAFFSRDKSIVRQVPPTPVYNNPSKLPGEICNKDNDCIFGMCNNKKCGYVGGKKENESSKVINHNSLAGDVDPGNWVEDVDPGNWDEGQIGKR